MGMGVSRRSFADEVVLGAIGTNAGIPVGGYSQRHGQDDDLLPTHESLDM
jgi:hypothetical protein